MTSLATNPEFNRLLGIFHASFSTLDITTDFAIGKFLKLTPQQTHLITGGMMFGPKARLLADLIGRSDHPRKAELLASFNRIRGNNKRDVIAHGYIWADTTSVTFIQRISSREFKAAEHTFTLPEFQAHVLQFIADGDAFFEALGATDAEMNHFGNAALSLNRKSKTSPA